MSAQDPTGLLTTEELLAISNFRRDRADNLDLAISTLADTALVIDVKAAPHFARGDGSTDDTAAIKSALAACSTEGGGVVYFPNGTYVVSQDGSAAYCIALSSNVTIRGASRNGAIVKCAGGLASSVRCFYATGDDIALENLTIDGNKANQTVNEQRHGLFSDTTNRLRVTNVTSKNFTGDGLSLYSNSNNATIRDCYITANDRDGISMIGAGSDAITIDGNEIVGNAVQQIDSEPGGPLTNIVIVNNRLSGGGISGDAVLTISGLSASVRSDGYTVANNQIDGGIFVVWCDNVTIANNFGVNQTAHPHCYVYRTCNGITVTGNTFTNTVLTSPVDTVVLVQAAGSGDSPNGVIISGNRITQLDSTGNGVQVEGAIVFLIDGNEINGNSASTTGTSGVLVRSTIIATPILSGRVVNNRISEFGTYGFIAEGNVTATIADLDVSHNTFDAVTAGHMPVCMEWDADSTHAVIRATCIGNSKTGVAGVIISGYPNYPMLIGGSREGRGVYSLVGSPEGVLSEQIGAVAYDRAGDATACGYIKCASPGANTGWHAITVAA